MSKLSGIELLQTLGEIARNCNSKCCDCELDRMLGDGVGCFKRVINNPEKAVEICEQWRKDNPRYMDKFFELFPNAVKRLDGTPKIWFGDLYSTDEPFNDESNYNLWRQPYKEV